MVAHYDVPALAKVLVATGKWSEEPVRVAVRAQFACEYCELRLRETPLSYKQFLIDQIVPRSAENNDDAEKFDNKAVACWTCNVHWKGSWDPRTRAAEATREALIQATRAYVAERRASFEKELEDLRSLIAAHRVDT